MSSAHHAAITIDLDDLWSYLRNRGDAIWQTYPSFLAIALPRIRGLLKRLDIQATMFVVGHDATVPKIRELLAAIADDGHEIANHSFEHRGDIHSLSHEAVREDFERTETAIREFTDKPVRGFRGPSFRQSAAIMHVLAERGYWYDSSSFPNIIGPLARAYHFATSNLTREEKNEQSNLFGNISEGLQTLRPYRQSLGATSIGFIPVTTCPLVRVPIHMTYLNYLSDIWSPSGHRYFKLANTLCRWRNLPMIFLLHASDFIGADDSDAPTFLPGMKCDADTKISRIEKIVREIRSEAELATMSEISTLIVKRGVAGY